MSDARQFKIGSADEWKGLVGDAATLPSVELLAVSEEELTVTLGGDSKAVDRLVAARARSAVELT